MNQGRIVEYIEEGNITSSLCLHDDGARLHLLTPSNREVNLSPKRALLISGGPISVLSPREEILSRLKQAEERRCRLQREVQVRDLWELVREEEEVFDSRTLAELCFGEKVSDDHVSALIRALFQDKLYFKMKDGFFLPNPEERVEQILREREEALRRERWLQEGSRWLKQVLEGRVSDEPECKEAVVATLVELALYQEDAPGFRLGKDLLARSGIADVAKAREILVRIGIWDEDENLDLLHLKVKTDFDAEEVEQSARLAQLPLDAAGREDLRGLFTITIDGPLTRDYDDAISMETTDGIVHLGIHVSDVAGLIPAGSPLDRGAGERGTSLYMPRRQIPMLPPALSQDILSLRQDKDRPALSLLAKLDGQGNLLEYRFAATLIRVKDQLTYDRVNERCGQDERLGALCRLTRLMRERRIACGALLLPLPEIHVKVGGNGGISIELVSQETASKILVAELMILYNWLAARFCRDHGVPVLYRCQAKPSELVPMDDPNDLYCVLKQRGKLSPLEIRTEPGPHNGLGLDIYTNASSPIRRYFDLVIQRQIRNHLLGLRLPYGAEELERTRITLDPMLRELERMKRNRIRYWVLKYLSRHVGETFPALVMGMGKAKYRIVMTDFLLVTEMKRQEGQGLCEGDHILVKVRKSDPWDGTLRLEPVGR
ncbi:MAG: RNB domain-containing ribonuclease [Thermodesulfobacteriota bacterium]